ncbi:uncharacterized protein LOC129944160 isoform X6 [Eupeodes corollae]|uniref:uncharacterized protein LOC129944160 isoform X6 n=1 Tax=Eupeodes corollae TaxID=290404 RepID=UPI0024928265|nr:uncharacterized protein LOC129944160 isoform X6 [Eupeodes corollae]
MFSSQMYSTQNGGVLLQQTTLSAATKPASKPKRRRRKKVGRQYFEHDNRDPNVTPTPKSPRSSVSIMAYQTVRKKFKPLKPAVAALKRVRKKPAPPQAMYIVQCACAGNGQSTIPLSNHNNNHVHGILLNSALSAGGCGSSAMRGNKTPRVDINDVRYFAGISAIPIGAGGMSNLQQQFPIEFLSTTPFYGNANHQHRVCQKELRSVVSVRETHQIAEAQQEKNAKLREAFGISEYFVEGTSFDSDRKAREDLAKSSALQKELDAQKDTEKEKNKRYALVRTPSKEKEGAKADNVAEDGEIRGKVKKKKKKKNRDGSASPEHKKDKKKKSKKHKKESKSKKKKSRKRKLSESGDSSDSEKHHSDDDSSDSEKEVKKRKKSKKDKDSYRKALL